MPSAGKRHNLFIENRMYNTEGSGTSCRHLKLFKKAGLCLALANLLALQVVVKTAQAAPKMYLYKMPKSEAKQKKPEGGRRVQSGPIIGTPKMGSIERWPATQEKEVTSKEEMQWLEGQMQEGSMSKEEAQRTSADAETDETMSQMRSQILNLKPEIPEIGGNIAVKAGDPSANKYSRLNRMKETFGQGEVQDAIYKSGGGKKDDWGNTPVDMEAIGRSKMGSQGGYQGKYQAKDKAKDNEQEEWGKKQNESLTQTTAFGGDPFDGISKKELQKKIQRYNKALEVESKREQSEKKAMELDEATRFLYSKKDDTGEIEREGDKIILYQPTEKQKAVEQIGLPPAPKNTRPIWEFQVTPPNISQKVYSLTNNHLIPVTFQYEFDRNAFKMVEDARKISNLHALLGRITDINMQNEHGNTLLMSSVANANYDAMLLLLQNGANINMPNDYGVTPIHLAVYKQDQRATQILLERRPDTGTFDSNGFTPLMYAIILGDRGMIKALVEAGANVLLENSRGISALSMAQEYNEEELIAYLEINAANVFTSSGAYVTPFGRPDSNISFSPNK